MPANMAIHFFADTFFLNEVSVTTREGPRIEGLPDILPEDLPEDTWSMLARFNETQELPIYGIPHSFGGLPGYHTHITGAQPTLSTSSQRILNQYRRILSGDEAEAGLSGDDTGAGPYQPTGSSYSQSLTIIEGAAEQGRAVERDMEAEREQGEEAGIEVEHVEEKEEEEEEKEEEEDA